MKLVLTCVRRISLGFRDQFTPIPIVYLFWAYSLLCCVVYCGSDCFKFGLWTDIIFLSLQKIYWQIIKHLDNPMKYWSLVERIHYICLLNLISISCSLFFCDSHVWTQSFETVAQFSCVRSIFQADSLVLERLWILCAVRAITGSRLMFFQR